MFQSEDDNKDNSDVDSKSFNGDMIGNSIGIGDGGIRGWQAEVGVQEEKGHGWKTMRTANQCATA